MSRRSSAIRRDLLPDPRYDSVEVSKFINNLMIDGKKSLSERIFYEALDICQEKSGQPGLTVFTQALNNSKPSLEVKSRRVGGATYQVPIEVRPDPSRKQVEPLERVEVDYRQSDGAGRVVCAQTGPHQFRHSRAGLLENMTFRVRGGDYVNRRPFRVEVVDPPEMEQVVVDCTTQQNS